MISLRDYLKSGQTTLSNLLIENYRQLGLTNDEFILWIQLYKYHESGNDFPDLAPIAVNMNCDQKEIYNLLNQLVEKQVIAIESEKNSQGIRNDFYDFSAIFEKLEVLQKQQEKKTNERSYEQKVQSLYQMFEKEFGRALSPIEYQRIGQWIEEDEYQPDLIQLALKEAVLNQAYSLNYIDRVLLSWERKNITTKQQVEEEQKRRKRKKLKNETAREEKDLPNVSLHNWLEED
ncbi:DnaD domain protein [Tetragenococcus koreensis]|uniref:DNA replication protein DnaD n=1 Tax=Tetragenococcus koreensis TaxID=290335 RepID=A0AAN4ZTI6_9ENTE|nr:DnaD domain protein [Tetragenococcus koreensis]MDN6590670.1 DnaD domain protein [Lactobacillus sp.]AYW44981.1 DNA replication protein DnaD [Tetragenococcus koreensis]MCF1586098.1 DnaD domain protein [Tetragenococcus koreensis]MCF1615682.1 DnaD domain protein [Tetragenococcus koreensis]MCF1616400.1 DnaD domain protein [Tetragenococcus koreensis]